MSEPTQLTSEQKANLVAYLDGELNEEDTQEMERALAASGKARHEVDMLSRTFSLLDTLPRPNASAEFSARTISALTAEVETEVWTQRPFYRRLRRGVIAASWAVGLVLAGMIGYYGGNRLVPREDVRVVQELPVIENLDAYEDVPDIQWLKTLKKKKLFDDERAEDEP